MIPQVLINIDKPIAGAIPAAIADIQAEGYATGDAAAARLDKAVGAVSISSNVHFITIAVDYAAPHRQYNHHLV